MKDFSKSIQDLVPNAATAVKVEKVVKEIREVNKKRAIAPEIEVEGEEELFKDDEDGFE